MYAVFLYFCDFRTFQYVAVVSLFKMYIVVFFSIMKMCLHVAFFCCCMSPLSKRLHIRVLIGAIHMGRKEKILEGQ